MLLSISVGLILAFLYFTSARDIEIEADQKIIKKVEDLNNVYLRYRGNGLISYIRRETSRPSLDIYRLYDANNNVLAGNVTEPNEIKVNDDGWIEFTYQINVNGEEEIYYGRGRDLVTPVENYRLLVGRVVNNEIKLKERFFYSSLWSIILIIY